MVRIFKEDTMKRFLFLVLIAIVLSLIITTSSCDLFGPYSRLINELVNDLNTQPAGSRNIIDNFHSTMTGRSSWALDSAFNGTEMYISFRTFGISLNSG